LKLLIVYMWIWQKIGVILILLYYIMEKDNNIQAKRICEMKKAYVMYFFPLNKEEWESPLINHMCRCKIAQLNGWKAFLKKLGYHNFV